MHLIKKVNEKGVVTKYTVSYIIGDEVFFSDYPTIDRAADYLQDFLNTDEDQVDLACIAIHQRNQIRAIFDSDKNYSHSEDK